MSVAAVIAKPPGLSFAEHRTLTLWVCSYDVNHEIRSGRGDSFVTFSNAMDKCDVIPAGTVLYRGTQHGLVPIPGRPGFAAGDEDKTEAYFRERIGKRLVWEDPRSASPIEKIGAAYAEPVLLRIKVGENGARDLSFITAERGEPRFKESVIAPGLFRVTDVMRTRVKDSFYETRHTRPVVLVDLEDETETDRVFVRHDPRAPKVPAQ